MKSSSAQSALSRFVYPVFIILFSLLGSEMLLRLLKKNATWSEEVGHGYLSGYDFKLDTWLFIRYVDSTFEVNQGEYKYLYTTNSIGIREKENPFTDSTATKIVCIGDSYTEGMGAPYDSSYPQFLGRCLNAKGINTRVYNAGVAGSDPFVLKLLEQKMIPLNPQIVLTTFNSSDLADYIFRGGNERFKEDGTTQYQKAPAIEQYYAKSYLCRMALKIFLQYNDNMFVSRNDLPAKYSEAVKDYAGVFDSMNTLLKNRNIRLLVIVQPIAAELAYDKEYNLMTFEAFDEIQEELQKRNILFVDMRDSLNGKITEENFKQYAYDTDAHYNSAGYQLFAEKLLATIQSKYPEFFF